MNMRLVVTEKGDSYVQHLIDDEVAPDPPDMKAEIILFAMDEIIEYDDNPDTVAAVTLDTIYHSWLNVYTRFSSYPPPTYDDFASCWNQGLIGGEAIRK